MRHESLLNEDWTNIVARLGGATTLDVTARATKAFLRHQCGGFAATDPGLLSGRARVAIDRGMGDVGRPCRYFQRRPVVSLASVRGLARVAGGSDACCRRAASKPWPDDPYH